MESRSGLIYISRDDRQVGYICDDGCHEFRQLWKSNYYDIAMGDESELELPENKSVVSFPSGEYYCIKCLIIVSEGSGLK